MLTAPFAKVVLKTTDCVTELWLSSVLDGEESVLDGEDSVLDGEDSVLDGDEPFEVLAGEVDAAIMLEDEA